MPEISLRVLLVDKTTCPFLYRRKVCSPLPILEVDDTLFSEYHSVATVARRHNAIKHIHAACYIFEDIGRSAHSHQVTRTVFGQNAVYEFYHFVHLLCGFTYGKPSDSISFGVEALHKLGRLSAEVFVDTALYNGEKCLRITVFRLGF